jgi:hypothetical protein
VARLSKKTVLDKHPFTKVVCGIKKKKKKKKNKKSKTKQKIEEEK